jgi:HNH endonuclease/AP2 domain
MLTQERLKELLSYNQETGVFTRIKHVSSNAKFGDVCANVKKHGAIIIRIDGKDYQAHRLAFLYMDGKWPEKCVDHIDGIRSNNKWANLRDVSLSDNQHNRHGPQLNNTTGYLGVTFHKARNKYLARIKLHGKTNHLGSFHSARDAHLAYEAAKKKYHVNIPK